MEEVPSREQLRKMKVVELRQSLSKLSLPQRGVKEELITRLIAHYEEQKDEKEVDEQQKMEVDEQQSDEENGEKEGDTMMVSIRRKSEEGHEGESGDPVAIQFRGESEGEDGNRGAVFRSEEGNVEGSASFSGDGGEQQKVISRVEEGDVGEPEKGEESEKDVRSVEGDAGESEKDVVRSEEGNVEGSASFSGDRGQQKIISRIEEGDVRDPEKGEESEKDVKSVERDAGESEKDVFRSEEGDGEEPGREAIFKSEEGGGERDAAFRNEEGESEGSAVFRSKDDSGKSAFFKNEERDGESEEEESKRIGVIRSVEGESEKGTVFQSEKGDGKESERNVDFRGDGRESWRVADLKGDEMEPGRIGISVSAMDNTKPEEGALEANLGRESPEKYEEPGRETVMVNIQKEGKRKKKKKRRRRRHDQQPTKPVQEPPTKEADVEIEYVQEDILKPGDPNYRQFHKILESFKISEVEESPNEMKPMTVSQLVAQAAEKSKHLAAQQEDSSSDEEEAAKEEQKMSKKKLRRLNRLTVAQLKQLVDRPDVVEMHDVTATDPKLLIHLKSSKNTVPVPRHWCFKRKYLQGKRGIEKPPFDLPDFIKATGVMEMRQALEEKEDAKSLKQKTRERVRPKMGKLTIDYQKLHDAFFKWQTKPKMTIHGDLYYEGKEFETRLRQKKPGDLSDELRRALGMPTGMGKHKFPPPWLVAMQRYGPPPSYPNLRIPGLNAPIPENCSFGYFVGGWGKPPVDETGRPLYGDVFGLEQQESGHGVQEEEEIDKSFWGELESEEEEEEEEEESEEEVSPQPEDIAAGLVTPMEGLVTPSGLTSIPAGMETPDMIQLRKKKIEEAMEQGGETPALYTVLPEKTASVGGAMMGSSHVYDVSAPSGKKSNTVEVALDPSELDLDTATLSARYDEQVREKQNMIQKEDLSDMVAEHAAKQKKRKRAAGDTGGKATKKLKEFKF